MNLLEKFTLKKRAKVNPKVLEELEPPKPKKETAKKSASKKTTKK